MIRQLPIRRIAPDNIEKLEPYQIFVFGSNLKGAHGKGAALKARNDFGAKQGVGIGPTGRCYALPTKDRNIKTLPLDKIAEYIRAFVCYAEARLLLHFLVTSVGTGLAGYRVADIAPLFFAHAIPPNVYLPESFWDWYDKNLDISSHSS